MIDYLAWFVGSIPFLAMSAYAWHLHRRLLAWTRLFKNTTNAERILLMWPASHGHPVKTLTLVIDKDIIGFSRLMNGNEVMARLPTEVAVRTAMAVRQLLNSAS